MPLVPHDITGVVLCGGKSRRMGGVEKPLLPLHGRPLVAHVLERLVPQVGRVIISANRELDAYRAFGHDVISDIEAGLGPLGGLASVAPHVRTPWIFCCPGDAPRLAADLILRLSDALPDDIEAAYPHDAERPQYLFLLVRTTACSSLGHFLAGQGRSVREWLGNRRVTSSETNLVTSTFTNVNDLETLARLNAQELTDLD